jgi:hypothetical protein
MKNNIIDNNKFFDEQGNEVTDLTKIEAGTTLRDTFGTHYKICHGDHDGTIRPNKKRLCLNQDLEKEYGPRFI